MDAAKKRMIVLKLKKKKEEEKKTTTTYLKVSEEKDKKSVLKVDDKVKMIMTTMPAKAKTKRHESSWHRILKVTLDWTPSIEQGRTQKWNEVMIFLDSQKQSNRVDWSTKCGRTTCAPFAFKLANSKESTKVRCGTKESKNRLKEKRIFLGDSIKTDDNNWLRMQNAKAQQIERTEKSGTMILELMIILIK